MEEHKDQLNAHITKHKAEVARELGVPALDPSDAAEAETEARTDFTSSLTEEMRAETIRDLMTGAFPVLAQCIMEHGGVSCYRIDHSCLGILNPCTFLLVPLVSAAIRMWFELLVTWSLLHG